jgi:hypothetical protein
MFEREIKFIYDFHVNQVKKLGASFTFNSLSALNLHPAILNYISAEIDYLIYEDRKRLIENSNFDYSGDEVKKYFALINQEIRKDKRLSVDYINQLIIHATSFTANFLAQPKWALTKLVYAKENILNTQEVKQILNYLYFYNHLRELIEKFLAKKRIVSLDKSEFEALIDKIYEQLFSSYPEKILDSVLFAVADFFNVGNVHKTKVNYLALELFLKEKKLFNYLDRLNNAIPEEAKQNYDIVELQKILYSPVPIKKENYLDRIVKQEEPVIIFSTDDKQEEIKSVEETILKEQKPVISEVSKESFPEQEEKLKSDEKIEESIQQSVKEETRIEEKGKFFEDIVVEKIILSRKDEPLTIDENKTLQEETLVKEESIEREKTLTPADEPQVQEEVIEEEEKTIPVEDFIIEIPSDILKITDEDVPLKNAITEDDKDEESLILSDFFDDTPNFLFKEQNNAELSFEELEQEETITPVRESFVEKIRDDIIAEQNYPSEVSKLPKEEKPKIEAVEEPIKDKEVIEDEKPVEKVVEKEFEELVFEQFFEEGDIFIVEDEKAEVNRNNIENEIEVETTEGNTNDVISNELYISDDRKEDLIETTETETEIKEGKVVDSNKEEFIKEIIEEDEISPQFEAEILKGLDDEIKILSNYAEPQINLSEKEMNVEENIDDKIFEDVEDKSETMNVETDTLENEEVDNKNIDIIQEEFKNKNEEILEKVDEEFPVIEVKEEEKEVIPKIEVKGRRTIRFEKDISYFFKGKNIDKIISNIFDDDAEDFAQTFETLSECNSLEEALSILDSLFKSYDVKLTSKEAKVVKNIVNEYFNQK